MTREPKHPPKGIKRPIPPPPPPPKKIGEINYNIKCEIDNMNQEYVNIWMTKIKKFLKKQKII